uniref:Uncharacterized protein n=1 Tax=Parascaris univalens TaxID=6257 RepID=A0A914ZJN5_PARUN
MATLIQATQPTDDTAALIPQQSQSVSTPPKPPVSFYARGFKGAHASFRLRMFQEQHGFEPQSQVMFVSSCRCKFTYACCD